MVDHVWWTLRHGTTHTKFLEYGLDTEGTGLSELVPYETFRRARDLRNRSPDSPYDYVCILRDKFVFWTFASAVGCPTPRVVALLTPDAVETTSPRRVLNYTDLHEIGDVDAFCKPAGGLRGRGIFTLEMSGDVLVVGGGGSDAEDVRAQVDGLYVVQERIVQHPDMAALHPPSVNTVRLVTVLEGPDVRILFSMVRTGSGGSVIDNYNSGTGLMVRVDLETGRLTGDAFAGPPALAWVRRHPDTGILFDGYPVPRFAEAVETVADLHRTLRYVHTVGWDVAITPDGVTVLEGNDNWGAETLLGVWPDFRKEVYALYGLG